MKGLLLIIYAFLCGYVIGELAPYYELENATQYFEDFIMEYDKYYVNEQEKEHRFQIFKENLEYVNHLNEISSLREGGPLTVFGITHFMDLTKKEFEDMYTGFGIHNYRLFQSQCNVLTDQDIKGNDAPESFDWRDRGVVSQVKQQGQCQSCYAFSTVGHLEGQNAIKHQQLVEFSEQQIVDCDKRSHGCNTGYMSFALTSLIEMGGIMRETDYPYIGRQGYCRFDRRRAALRVRSCSTYRLRSQEKLKQLLFNTGPISVAVKASDFQQYRGGVFNDRYCSRGAVNHAVLLVGYGTDPRDGPYWIIKNSYGSKFGESGYIRVQRGERAQSCGMMNEFMATATIE